MRRRWGAVVAAVLAVSAVVAGCGGGDGGGEPGEVLDQEDVDLGGGVVAVRIRYGSIDVRGDRSDVTGLVVVPGGAPPEGGWPVVAWAHSTTGVADACAPSARPSFAGVGRILTSLASEGFIAVATDYEGIGTDGDHPYLDGLSEARAVVDSVRAARSVAGSGAASTAWAVAGHSQGGHAAGFVAELAPSMAPELELLGAVAMAPVSDPATLSIDPLALVFLLAGWLSTDPDVDTHEFLTREGRNAVSAANEYGCEVSGPPLDAALIATPDPRFDAYLSSNVMAVATTTVPILVLQGTADPLTTPAQTLAAVGRWCALGVPVELRTYEADHGGVVAAAFADGVAWLRERFAGVPATPNCPP